MSKSNKMIKDINEFIEIYLPGQAANKKENDSCDLECYGESLIENFDVKISKIIAR
ncbi:MAG TPA: hypothetical protein PLZ43_13815 [bacterium]|nr:hypothetical protein [bacterium]